MAVVTLLEYAEDPSVYDPFLDRVVLFILPVMSEDTVAFDNLPEEYRNYFRDCGLLPVYEQARIWLKAYFKDPDIDIEEVFAIAKHFRQFLNYPEDTALEENQAMKFLEKRERP